MQTGNETGLVVSEASLTVTHRAISCAVGGGFLAYCATFLHLCFYTPVYKRVGHLGVNDVLVVLIRVKDFTRVLLALFVG